MILVKLDSNNGEDKNWMVFEIPTATVIAPVRICQPPTIVVVAVQQREDSRCGE